MDTRAFLDISVDNEYIGRIEFKFPKNPTQASRNFIALCKGSYVLHAVTGIREDKTESLRNDPSYKVLTYTGSKFHRIIPNFLIFGGDIEKNNGTGDLSIFKGKHADSTLKHNKSGILSTTKTGIGSGSQFFITTSSECEWLDEKCAPFGEVYQGMDILRYIEAQGSTNGKPCSEVIISNCGTIN